MLTPKIKQAEFTRDGGAWRAGAFAGAFAGDNPADEALPLGDACAALFAMPDPGLTPLIDLFVQDGGELRVFYTTASRNAIEAEAAAGTLSAGSAAAPSPGALADYIKATASTPAGRVYWHEWSNGPATASIADFLEAPVSAVLIVFNPGLAGAALAARILAA